MKKFCMNCGHQNKYGIPKCEKCGFGFASSSFPSEKNEIKIPIDVPFKVSISSDENKFVKLKDIVEKI